MKKIISLMFFSVFSLVAFSQTLVTEQNGRVTVRSANDSIIAQIDSVGSGAMNAVFNDDKTQISVIYTNGNIFIKKPDGTTIVQIAEENPDKAVNVAWSNTNVIITTQSNKTLVKNSLEWKPQ